MLLAGVQDPNNVYEVYGNQISNTIRYLGVHFQTFNLSRQFFRSVFLVQQGLPPKHSPKRVRTSLKLDKMDEISGKWVDSDVLIFNSGHWWTPSKLFEIGSNQKVYKVTKQPLSVAKANDRSELADIISEVIGNMSVPVTVLNVTSMGAYRSDAHVGALSHPRTLIAAISVFLECQMLGMSFCSLIFRERFRAPRFPLEVESETFGSECEIICASGFIWWMNRGKAVHLQERHKLLYLDHKKNQVHVKLLKNVIVSNF